MPHIQQVFFPLLRVQRTGNLLEQDKRVCLWPSLSFLYAPIFLPSMDVPKGSFPSDPAMSKGFLGLILIAKGLQASTLASCPPY